MRYILSVTLLALGAVFAAQEPTTLPTSDEVPVDRASADLDLSSSAEEPGSGDTADGEADQAAKTDAVATADPVEESVMEPKQPSWREILDDVLGSGAMGLLLEGGFFMWPILLMGIIAAGVIIERYRSLRMLGTDTTALRAEVAELLRTDRLEEALETCNAQQGPVPAVLSAGVRKFLVLRRLNYDVARIEEQVVKAIDDYSVHIVAAMERHLPVLATVSSVAPMLGFLGTVQGMIIAFRDIVAKMGETNIVEAAAGGIQTALLTTCFGLIVGIPAFIAYNYFTSVINRYVLDVEESASELMETITLHIALEEQDDRDSARS